MHAVRGVIEDAVFRFSPDDAVVAQPETHLPRVLAFYYESFLEIARTDALSILVPHQADMVPVVESIAHFCGIEISPAHRAQMRARAAFHAKDAREIFLEAPIEGAFDGALRECQERYEALEKFRDGQSTAR